MLGSEVERNKDLPQRWDQRGTPRSFPATRIWSYNASRAKRANRRFAFVPRLSATPRGNVSRCSEGVDPPMKAKRCAWAANPKKAVAYLRVSTDRETQALGIYRPSARRWSRGQSEMVLKYASGSKRRSAAARRLREAGASLRAIAALGDHGAGLLVVQRLDRFSRDPLTAAMAELQVQRLGARVVSADGMGNGDDPGIAVDARRGAQLAAGCESGR